MRDLVRSVDFAQWNGDVSGWTVGRIEHDFRVA